MAMYTQSQNTSCFDRMKQCAEGTYIPGISLSDEPSSIQLCVQLMVHNITVLWVGEQTGIFVTWAPPLSPLLYEMPKLNHTSNSDSLLLS